MSITHETSAVWGGGVFDISRLRRNIARDFMERWSIHSPGGAKEGRIRIRQYDR